MKCGKYNLLFLVIQFFVRASQLDNFKIVQSHRSSVISRQFTKSPQVADLRKNVLEQICEMRILPRDVCLLTIGYLEQWSARKPLSVAMSFNVIMDMIPLGASIAYGDLRSNIYVLSTSGEHMYSLKGHQAAISSLALLPPHRLVSYSIDGNIRLWDLLKRSCIASSSNAKKGSHLVFPYGDKHVMVCSPKEIVLYHAENMSLVRSCKINNPLCMLSSCELLSVDVPNKIRRWTTQHIEGELQQESPIEIETLCTEKIIRGAMSPSGKFALAFYKCHIIEIWDLTYKKLIKELQTDQSFSHVQSLLWLSQGQLAVATHDNKLLIYDGETGVHLQMIEFSKSSEFIPISRLIQTADNVLAIGSSSGQVYMFDQEIDIATQ